MASAEVQLTSLDDRTEHSATTDDKGTFQFANLKAGRYELFVRANGFADLKMTSLQLDARQTLREDVQLKLASATQSIEVAGDSGIIVCLREAFRPLRKAEAARARLAF